MTVCEKCRNDAPQGSRFCNSCGAPLTPPVESPQPKVNPGESLCPKCGNAVPLFRSNCPNCGGSIGPTSMAHHRGPVRACERCDRPVGPGIAICAICSSSDASAAVAPRPKSSRPTIVGILLLGAFVLSVISFVNVMVVSDDVEGLYPVDISGFLVCCGAIVLVASVSCLAGALLSFRRSKHILVVLAAAIGMLGAGPFFLGSVMSMIAMILAAISGDDYGG